MTEEWKESIKNWWERRYNMSFEQDWIIFTTGVIPAVTCSVKRLTNVGDGVVVMTPVYDIFFHSIENQGRHVMEHSLVYKDEQYEIDWNDFEHKLAHPQTTLLILCNPHNPIGKIWNKEELFKIGELCAKYNVVVLSDEIHCDLTDPGIQYIPFASVSEVCAKNSVTCISTSKAFNLAGLQAAAVIIPSEKIRNIMDRGLNSDEIAEPNVFAADAMIAAFNKGEEWLEELREYLYQNKKIVSVFLEKEIPKIKLVSSQATYLLWFDCSNIQSDATKLCQFIREETGLYLANGHKYRGNGSSFIRMNIACPKSVLMDGLERFKQGVYAYEKKMGHL